MAYNFNHQNKTRRQSATSHFHHKESETMPPLREHTRDQAASPYSRPVNSSAPGSPAVRRAPPNTPGGLFSRVKTMFSPTTWLRDANKSVDDSLADFDESDSSIASLQSETSRVPSNPLDEFRTMRHQSSVQQMRKNVYSRAVSESPNAKLAKFFAKKGSEPLTEIEMEGVRALLTQSTSPVGTPNQHPLAQQEEDSEENITNESLVLKPDTSDNSLLTATPSFKATYNDSDVDPEISISSNATPKRRVFDYSGFPSPYRSSRLKRSTFALNCEYEKSQKKLEEEEEEKKKKKEEPKPEKKLSNTATALLSFITNNGTEDEKKEDTVEDENKKEVDFSNPYARKKSTRSSISKKPSPLEQLEKTLQAHSPLPEEKKQPVVLDKYKPAKSSSLRESVIANDDFDMDEETVEEEPQEKNIEDKPSFGFGNNAGFTGFTTKKTEETATKPAFSFGSKTDEKKDEPTPKPAFSFGATPAPSDDTEKPAPSFASTDTSKPFTFGTSPSSSTTTTKPAFSFNTTTATTATTESKDSDGDDNVEDESNLSLTIKPAQEIQQVNGHTHNTLSQFVFPGAEDLGFTMKDVDESKVHIYRSLYTF